MTAGAAHGPRVAPWPTALTLIAITDHMHDGPEALEARTLAAVRGGATMVQVRLKDMPAGTLVAVVRRLVAVLPVPVVVNDRVDVAVAAGAAGVHVGADDLPVSAVRAVAPVGFVIGASLGALSEAANARDADYVGIGPVFGSASKPDAGMATGLDGLKRLAALTSLPYVGIGGITSGNAGAVIACGAAGVAAIAGIFGDGDPERSARAVRTNMGR